MTLLGVGSELRGDRAVLSLRGELDLSTVPEAEEVLERLESEAGSSTLVVDLQGLTFMDSTGLRFLLAAYERGRRSDRRLLLVRGNEPVQRVFRLTQLDERLTFVDDPDAVPGGDEDQEAPDG